MRRVVALASVVLAHVACSGSGSPPVESGGGSAPPLGTSGTSSSSGAPSGSTTDVAKNPEWSAARCTTHGTGFAVGEAIGDLGVTDCDSGAPASIDDMCGASATWIFAAHTHCPTCQATAAFTDDVAQAVADKSVAIIQLVYDDNGTSCAKWKAAYKLGGFANVKVYADPDGVAWNKLKVRNVTAASAFLDANRTITFKDHSLSKADILTQIDAALSR